MTLLEKAEQIKRKNLEIEKILRLLAKQDFIDFYLDLSEDQKQTLLGLLDVLEYEAIMTMFRTNTYERMTVKELRIIAVRKGIKYPNIYDKWSLVKLLEKKDAALEVTHENGTVKGPGHALAKAE